MLNRQLSGPVKVMLQLAVARTLLTVVGHFIAFSEPVKAMLAVAKAILIVARTPIAVFKTCQGIVGCCQGLADC